MCIYKYILTYIYLNIYIQLSMAAYSLHVDRNRDMD